MRDFWFTGKKGELPFIFGCVTSFVAFFLASITVYPSLSTFEAVRAGTHPPLACNLFWEHLVGFVLSAVGLYHFVIAARYGESPYKKSSYIGIVVACVFVLALGFAVGKASLTYAKWRGWIN